MAKRATSDDADRDRFTVYLPRATRLALLKRALDETAEAGRRVSATEIVERLINEYLGRKGGRHGHA